MVGIATVCIYVEAFRHRAISLQVPRALVTPFPMGRNLGAPGNAEEHLRVLRGARPAGAGWGGVYGG